MKRRNFLINSAAALGGCTLFSGCAKKEVKKEGSVTRRKFKDIEVPLLGLGCMRLPMKNEKEIDMVELDKMVEYAMNHGVNYFDTGYFYVNSKSENAIGKILKKYKRESYFLSDKLPIPHIHKKEDTEIAYNNNSKEYLRTVFNEQLKRCGCDYFDFYMAHGISKDNYDIYKNVEMHNELLELKKEGKIKYLGFSFHSTLKDLKEVVAEGNWDFCQLQLNYLDWSFANAREEYEIATKAGLPILVMEPLKGGWLLSQPDKKEMNELDKKYPNTSYAEFALRWAGSLDNVITVLSGMSNLEQMKENIKTFENFKVMTNEEKRVAGKIAENIISRSNIICTGCKYCIPACPKGIDIIALINLYNKYKVLKDEFAFTNRYETLSAMGKFNDCTKCGLCSKNCPQKLNVPEILAEIRNEYKKIKNT